MQVHHGNNLNPVIPLAVDDPEGEPGDTALPPRLGNYAIQARMDLNTLDRRGDGLQKAPAETRSLRFIVPN